MKVLLFILSALIPLSSRATSYICEESFGAEKLGPPQFRAFGGDPDFSYVEVTIPVLEKIHDITEVSGSTFLSIQGSGPNPSTFTGFSTTIEGSNITFTAGARRDLADKVYFGVVIHTESCPIHTRGEYSFNKDRHGDR